MFSMRFVPKNQTNSHENMNGKLKDNIIWILESGTSYHMTHLRSIIQTFKRINKKFHIITPNGDSTMVEISEMWIYQRILFWVMHF